MSQLGDVHTVERIQTGVRMEKRLLKVLRAFADYHDLTLGDLLEGIVLHAFDGKCPFSKESLQRIQELFPREEERNQDLQQLYLAAGMTPQHSDSVPPAHASAAAKAAPASTPSPARTSAPAESADVNSFTKVAACGG